MKKLNNQKTVTFFNIKHMSGNEMTHITQKGKTNSEIHNNIYSTLPPLQKKLGGKKVISRSCCFVPLWITAATLCSPNRRPCWGLRHYWTKTLLKCHWFLWVFFYLGGVLSFFFLCVWQRPIKFKNNFKISCKTFKYTMLSSVLITDL